MTSSNLLRKGLAAVLVVACGLLAGFAARVARDGLAQTESTPPEWTAAAETHNEAAYDRATVRFTGRLGPEVLAETRGLSFQSTVLVVLRGPDVAACEDLGRQLRELSRAAADRPGRGIAILIDPAGEAGLRRFLARERIPGMPLIVTDPARLLADGRKVATPAALVADGSGRIWAGVSHTSRFKGVRGRSFSQELPLREPGSS
jgi:hypothetical protein